MFKRNVLKYVFWSLLIVPVAFLVILIGGFYWQQDAIVRQLLESVNKGYKGHIELKESHVSLFANFPYVSIDLKETKVYENKEKNTTPIVDLKDLYIGFDLWTILSGDLDIKKIKLSNGNLNIVQHPDGEFNIVKALSSLEQQTDESDQELHLNLKEIKLEKINLTKFNEEDSIEIDAYITKADSRFETSPEYIVAAVDARFELNILEKGDTTFFKHKHFETNTEISFLKEKGMVTFLPTAIKLEGAEFNFEGTADLNNDLFLDMKITGKKSNFDLFIAMAPEELIPTLKKYENEGDIFFDVSVNGKSINGHTPYIEASFGCKNAYFDNYKVNKKLADLNFAGYFNNGEKRNITTMEFGIENFSARPEAGRFSGNLKVKNFQSPDINLQLTSDFELDFLAKFFELEGVKNLKGKISLTMNFHDIIDLQFPEKSIEKLNESYFTQLKIEDLSFKSDAYALPVRDFDLYAELNGHEAEIKYCSVAIGHSDISIKGSISDLPAILHHTAVPVKTSLDIKSKLLDLYELTGSDSVKSVNEQIENLSLNLAFKSSAKAFTESPNLPVGEFFVENLYAKLKHYPHTLHDFHADVFIDEENFRVVDFKGMIDKSDFLFSGRLKHYDLWFEEDPEGDTKLEFNFTSKLLKLEDLFAYKGEAYVPEEYRHEELKNSKMHGYADLHFRKDLKSIDVYFDKFDTKMKVHPLRFENFKGRFHYEDKHLVVENFSGKMGRSDFYTTLHYYLGEDESIKKRDNHFKFISSRLDLDELLNYTPVSSSAGKTSVDHDSGFNIYELPFTNMTFDVKVNQLNYHRYLIQNLNSKLRTTPEHYVYIDQMHLEAAGGTFDISGGYFNGSDPKKIYFSPNMKIRNIDLDKFLWKFDNFGQDHLVSENLHGKFSGTITGNIHMHNDLVPKIDDSEIHMEVEVVEGRLENYALLDCLSDYFIDKNLKKVLFDTLTNHIDLSKGVLSISNMRINSSLGFVEFSGKQDMEMNMEYYLRVPLSLVTNVAANKLFGKKKEDIDPDREDAIQYADPGKRTRFLNIQLTGNPENYKISLGKDKSSAPSF